MRFSWPCCFELLAESGGAAILPDDGVVDGLAGGAVPDDGGFALVGDADGGDVAGLHSALAKASRATAICDAAISSGSCSTHPGWGKICVNSRWATDRTAP